MTYLALAGLKVAFRQPDGRWIIACRGVNLKVEPRKRYAVIGESGSGKSVTVKAAMGYLVPSADVCIHADTISFFGREHGERPSAELAALRRRDIMYIPQDNMNALDPVYTAEEVVTSRHRLALEEHDRRLSPRKVRAATEAAYQHVVRQGISLTRSPSHPAVRVSDIPIEWYSGGMRQLVFLASAMMTEPRLLVIDEGTTALDAIKENRYFTVIAAKGAPFVQNGGSVLFISHDITLARTFSDFMYVLYAGVVVESGPSEQLLDDPRHPYTRSLINALDIDGVPECAGAEGLSFDNSIHYDAQPGPSQFTLPACPFRSRCAAATAECDGAMPEETIDPDNAQRLFRCFNPCVKTSAPSRVEKRHILRDKEILLQVKNAGVTACGRRILSTVDLEIRRCEAVGLVGGSGHGKSTLIKALIGLPGYRIYGRERCVALGGEPLDAITRVRRRRLMQYVPQIVNDAFLENITTGEALLEPLFADSVDFRRNIPSCGEKIRRALADVGLPFSLESSAVSSLSGGQRQRVAIGRALIALGVYEQATVCEDKLLLLDEPTSSLDAGVRADILRLLHRLQRQHSLSCLLISHDLEVVLRFCTRIFVVHCGSIVEEIAVDDLSADAGVLHPYTRDLFGFTKQYTADPVPDFSALPKGCRYGHVCPAVRPLCRLSPPPLRSATGTCGHRIACFRGGMNASGEANNEN